MGIPTRIINLHTVPNPPTVGNPPTLIEGTLQSIHSNGEWGPLIGAPVQVYVNGLLAGDVVTDGSGNFQAAYAFPKPGTYTITAEFNGDLGWDSSTASITVNVVQQAPSVGSYLAIVIPAAAIAGLAIAFMIPQSTGSQVAG